jgi:hypothetical protein
MRQESDLGNLRHSLNPAELLDADTPEGVDLDDLPLGAVLEIETSHNRYLLENRGEGKVVLSGHPEFCPEPILLKFHGSVGGAALVKARWVEPGLKMAFEHPQFGTLRTSRVRSVHLAAPATTH